MDVGKLIKQIQWFLFSFGDGDPVQRRLFQDSVVRANSDTMEPGESNSGVMEPINTLTLKSINILDWVRE